MTGKNLNLGMAVIASVLHRGEYGMNFMIQTKEGQIEHDFSSEIIKSGNYLNWYFSYEVFRYVLTDKIFDGREDNFIPSGDINFVGEYLRKYFSVNPKPINVPKELEHEKFTCRKIFTGTEADAVPGYFAKSADIVKAKPVMVENNSLLPTGKWQFSEWVEFMTEWRVFVWNRKVQSIHMYSGDVILPDMGRVYEMINEYKSCPIAYTLDVGVTDTGQTAVIEVHDMYSVGLYGFSDYSKLAYMFSQWWNEYIRRNKK